MDKKLQSKFLQILQSFSIISYALLTANNFTSCYYYAPVLQSFRRVLKELKFGR